MRNEEWETKREGRTCLSDCNAVRWEEEAKAIAEQRRLDLLTWKKGEQPLAGRRVEQSLTPLQ